MSFRYHLVSLAAVLTALAAGVVLGAGPLSERVDAVLSPSPSAPADSTVAELQARVAFDDAYGTATEPDLLADRLTERRVVLVVLPGAAADVVTATTTALTTAGAEVSGQVRLTDAWSDPGQASVLSGIAGRLAPPDAATPAGASPYEVAAGALAAALVTTQRGQVGLPSDPATALLTGLAEGGFLTTTGEPENRAGLALVLSPAQPADGSLPAYLPVAPALDAAGGAVLAGPAGSADDGGLVAAVRADETLSATASTVDVVDLAAGRVAAVLALAERADGGRGAYGMGPGADAPVPTAS